LGCVVFGALSLVREDRVGFADPREYVVGLPPCFIIEAGRCECVGVIALCGLQIGGLDRGGFSVWVDAEKLVVVQALEFFEPRRDFGTKRSRRFGFDGLRAWIGSVFVRAGLL